MTHPTPEVTEDAIKRRLRLLESNRRHWQLAFLALLIAGVAAAIILAEQIRGLRGELESAHERLLIVQRQTESQSGAEPRLKEAERLATSADAVAGEALRKVDKLHAQIRATLPSITAASEATGAVREAGAESLTAAKRAMGVSDQALELAKQAAESLVAQHQHAEETRQIAERAAGLALDAVKAVETLTAANRKAPTANLDAPTLARLAEVQETARQAAETANAARLVAAETDRTLVQLRAAIAKLSAKPTADLAAGEATPAATPKDAFLDVFVAGKNLNIDFVEGPYEHQNLQIRQSNYNGTVAVPPSRIARIRGTADNSFFTVATELRDRVINEVKGDNNSWVTR